MFRETVTSADGEVTESACTEEHALRLLRTAVRRGYRTEATSRGGAVITRELAQSRKRTVTLEPVSAARVTATMRRDLGLIAMRGASLLENGRIRAGYLYGIPPATSARLISRGLVTVTGTSVAVSLAARLAMLAQDHRASASKPRGYYHDPDHLGPWRKGSCIYDRSSVASCPCRWSKPAGDVEDARRYAREHREAMTAALVRGDTGSEAHDQGCVQCGADPGEACDHFCAARPDGAPSR